MGTRQRQIRDLLTDRRFLASVIAMSLLFILGYFKSVAVSDSIALVAISLAGANAAQAAATAFARRGKKKKSPNTSDVS